MSTEFATPQPAGVAAKAPTTIQVAIVLTWLGAAGTAALTLMTTVFFLWFGSEVFDTFDSGTGNPRFWLILIALVILVLCVVAALLAWHVMRGRGWASWGLLALCVVTVLAGAVTAAGIFPLVPALLAISVAVCLLLPDSRAWFRAGQPGAVDPAGP